MLQFATWSRPGKSDKMLDILLSTVRGVQFMRVPAPNAARTLTHFAQRRNSIAAFAEGHGVNRVLIDSRERPLSVHEGLIQAALPEYASAQDNKNRAFHAAIDSASR